MTDYTKLIERLNNTPNWQRESYGDWKQGTVHYDRAPFEAADAIEALQAECSEHKENAMRNARIAVSIKTERDQLQAKLDELQRQDADWFHAECDDPDYSGFYQSEADAITQVNEHGGYVTSLYAAPKALEPLTDEQIAEIVRDAAKGAATRRDGTTSTRIARAIEAAHGIGSQQ